MKTVEILVSHTGYPSGKKRAFAKGEEVDVPDAYADLITSEAKKLAREVPAAKAAPATKTESEK